MESREKTSFALKPSCKLALEKLKLRLRSAGLPRADATEGAVIETLVRHADFDELLRRLSQ